MVKKMRLRNVKGAKEKIEASSIVIQNPKDYKGKFKDVFLNNNPIYIEIGTGKGNFIINMAKNNPNINFIGIEKFDSVLVRALDKIDEYIPNLRLIRMDATEIADVFDHEIDCIYLNFSDPWPKNKHENRRLTSKVFLDKYELLFKENNHIIMKTDNRHLFEYSVESLVNNNYKIINVCLDLHKEDIKDNVETEYESKFKLLGPIYKIEVEK